MDTRRAAACLLVLVALAPRGWAQTPEFLLKWGTTGTGNGQFDLPRRLAADRAGFVYVADRNNARIQKFDSDGMYIMQWGSPGTGDGQFDFPFGVAVDESSNVYVAERSNNRIQKFTAQGQFIVKWGSAGTGDGEFNFPVGITVSPSGHVYVADSFNHRIQKFTRSGDHVMTWGSLGSANGQFDTPVTLASDAVGDVYVGDAFNYRIQKFSADGVYITQWGSQGTGDTEFQAPRGVSVDSIGNVYVVDQIDNSIKKFASNGSFLTKWGGFGSGDGEFNRPEDIDIDGDGNIFVTDPSNDRIQKFGNEMVPVSLTLFEAWRKDNVVVLRWKVGRHVVNHVGFHIYRQMRGQAPVRINRDLLQGQQDYTFVDSTPPVQETLYWLYELDGEGDHHPYGPVSVPSGAPALLTASVFPNPFNPEVTIQYSIPKAGPLVLTVYNSNGAKVTTLVDRVVPAGDWEVTWTALNDNATAVSSGVYFVRLKYGTKQLTRKLVFLK